jgi:hypothetical protein
VVRTRQQCPRASLPGGARQDSPIRAGGGIPAPSVRSMNHEGTDPKTDTGSEGDASADTALPFVPRKDDQTPVGDTDQHSKVSHDGTKEEAQIKKQGANQS